MDTEEKNGTHNGEEIETTGTQGGSENTKRELTAAQKKREKAKLKKALAQQGGDDGKADSVPAADGTQEESQEAADGEKGGDDKKKKKKKKPAAKEEEKPKETSRKGPSKAQIAAIQETIRKAKEEEDRLLKEEEDKVKQLDEAEDLRLEKLRLEQERRERKKQKEKEKKQRLKDEGKWLTPKEKLAKQRAQAMLDSLKAQGIEVPEAGTEKKPRPGTRVRPKKMQSQTSQDGTTNENNGAGCSADSDQPAQTEAERLAEIEAVKEAWDQESEDEKEEPQTEQEEIKPPKDDKNSEKSSDEEDSERSKSDENDDSEDSSSDSDSDNSILASEGDNKRKEKETAQCRIQKRREENEKGRSVKNLRAPVVCVLGHVDTGKTKILDKLRRTNVQDNEAGGITQQIGATNVPIEAIQEASKFVKNFAELELKVPGLLIIDTPGHESFSNLRSRGSSLCDVAILVVDIMHGLEPQTIESLNLLKAKKTPFVVALNKIDRLYEWQSSPKRDIRDVLKTQHPNTSAEFEKRKQEVILQFAEQGFNAAIFYENPDTKTYFSMIPTSAFTGDGMGNLMALIVELSQSRLAKRLMYSKELQATVLEVKAISGLGTTIDVILINGHLRVGETMILAGTEGPVTTQIRSLMTPRGGMKELRVKNEYEYHNEISGAIGVKIAGKDLEKAIAGLNIQIAYHSDEIDVCREEVAREFKSALSSIRLSERGVYVQASTLGSLEALLEFLKTSSIPYSGIRIGPVVKKDVMKASIMLEHDSQYAVILAFDVKIERDAQDLADNLGVRIFQADIIYHLFDKFMAYRDELKAKKRDEFKHIAVFPCKLKILPQFIFNSRDPIVCGVIVEAGVCKEGTPICVPNREFLEIGRVTSIEINHKQVNTATKGQEVCIKIEPTPGDSPKMLGRHFEETDLLVSKITRESIDACKDYFRNDLQKSDWQLMVELKKMFQIM